MNKITKKLTPLPSDKNVDPIIDIVLPMGFVVSVHSLVIVSRNIPDDIARGFILGVGTVGLAVLFFKAYKASAK